MESTIEYTVRLSLYSHIIYPFLKDLMKKYHPESSLTAEEKLKRVAAKVGLSMPPEKANSPLKEE